MKKRFIFCMALMPLILTGCGCSTLGGIINGNNGNNGSELEPRRTVSKDEWNSIFTPDSFMNNYLAVFDSQGRVSLFVNRGKVIGQKIPGKDYVEYTFQSYDIGEIYGIPQYAGTRGNFIYIDENNGYMSSIDLFGRVLPISMDYTIQDLDYHLGKKPLIQYEDATYIEKENGYIFTDSGNITFKIQFKNGIPEFFAVAELKDGAYVCKSTESKLFLSGEKYSRRNEVSETEWNRYFIDGGFVLDSKCLIYCLDFNVFISVDHGKVELSSNVYTQMPYDVFNFAYQTVQVPTEQGLVTREGIYSFVDKKITEEITYKWPITIADFLCLDGLILRFDHVLTYSNFYCNDYDEYYRSNYGAYTDPRTLDQNLITYRVMFIDSKPFMIASSEFNAYFVWQD